MFRLSGLLALFLIVAALLAHFVYRPWQMTWGANKAEIWQPMPGDEVIEAPNFVATRAVTIHTGPEQIWPWLSQMGYLRAGFYSHDILDNEGIASAESILPEFQNLSTGDLIPLSGDTNAQVIELERNQHMTWLFLPDSIATWAWGLYPTNEGTRLVTRLRVRTESWRAKLMLEYFEIFMMSKCMLGIKRRAEGQAMESPRS
jgi:hypothetical protein